MMRFLERTVYQRPNRTKAPTLGLNVHKVKEVEDSSLNQAHLKPSLVDQAHQVPSLVAQVHQKHHPHEGGRRLFPKRSSISRTLSSIRKQKILPQMDETYQTSPSVRKQKTLPLYFRHLKNTILSKEAKDSSSNRSNLSNVIIEEA